MVAMPTEDCHKFESSLGYLWDTVQKWQTKIVLQDSDDPLWGVYLYYSGFCREQNL